MTLFVQSCRLALLATLRGRLALLPVLLFGLGLGLLRQIRWHAGAAGASFALESLSSTCVLLCWIISLMAQPYLLDRGGILLGACSPQRHPTRRSIALAGLVLGSSLGLLVATLLIGLLASLLQPTGLVQAVWPQLAALGFGWLGGVSLLIWTLLLSTWMPRPVVLVLTTLILIADLCPGILGESSGIFSLRVGVFPVSPFALQAEDLGRNAALGRHTLAAFLHVGGLLALFLLFGSSGGRSGSPVATAR